MSTNVVAGNYKIGTSQIYTPECDISLAVLICINGNCAEINGKYIALQILLASL
jgi:hypothetical protein